MLSYGECQCLVLIAKVSKHTEKIENTWMQMNPTRMKCELLCNLVQGLDVDAAHA